MGASASASLLDDTHTDTQTHTSEYFTNKPVKGRGGGGESARVNANTKKRCF